MDNSKYVHFELLSKNDSFCMDNSKYVHCEFVVKIVFLYDIVLIKIIYKIDFFYFLFFY